MGRLGSPALGIVVAAMAIVLLFAGWPWSWTWDRDFNRTVTVKNFIRIRQFEPNKTHRAQAEKLANGDYLVTLYKGPGDREGLHMTLPSEKVNIVKGDGNTSLARLVYNKVPLFSDYADERVDDWRAPHSGGDDANRKIKELQQLSLGELLKVDLRVVNVTIPSQLAVSGNSSNINVDNNNLQVVG